MRDPYFRPRPVLAILSATGSVAPSTSLQLRLMVILLCSVCRESLSMCGRALLLLVLYLSSGFFRGKVCGIDCYWCQPDDPECIPTTEKIKLGCQYCALWYSNFGHRKSKTQKERHHRFPTCICAVVLLPLCTLSNQA